LKEDAVAGLERMAEKSAQNLLEEIEASKKNSLARLIYALGIQFVGERTGQLLAEHFSSLEELAAASEEQLEEVPEVGPKVAASIVEFFSEPANRQLIKKLRKAGVHPTAEKRKVKSDKFAGKSFVFTGGLANRSREEAGEIVQQHGGKVSGSVSKKTDYVVVGTDPGSKFDLARELGVMILTEAQFDSLVTAPQMPTTSGEVPSQPKQPAKATKARQPAKRKRGKGAAPVSKKPSKPKAKRKKQKQKRRSGRKDRIKSKVARKPKSKAVDGSKSSQVRQLDLFGS